ncbi:ABC-type Mn/Zn transport system, permease component, fragment [Candidatus Phytoplasma mali]|uniref:ABC-type Mn/Zn transport system, permease component n=1 Tax=Phytoplasma mali (strain AT) TaxID=482235 RepID=B3R027_PHYMT|nr:metal ABC transporter permease [Candidatus Phytoplasma mali]CAP18191.1 ABC-type Mn/Zn transport system, permease component [Candidatus Phytoplasma mali]CAP18681.1 ABC-type Mn/Zn transport system, permease component, fragment [Candidatus Phytoplasma mali]
MNSIDDGWIYILKILLGTSCLAITAGFLGVFLVLKKQALVGDALSHSCIPGIVIVYLITNEFDDKYLFLGAFIASFLVLFLIEIIKKYTKKIKYDAILTLLLSSFFGLGKVLLSYAQIHAPDTKISRLDKFFLGQAASISHQQLKIIIIIFIVVFFIITLFWKELKLFIFNEEYATIIGIKPKIMNFIINSLTILVVIIGLQIVGVILISSLIIAPGLIARNWSNRLSLNFLIAGFCSIIASILGVLISSFKINESTIPTGPAITLILSIFVFLSLLLAPQNGIIKNNYRHYHYKKKIIIFKKLIHFYTNKNDLNNLNIEKINPLFFEQGYLILKENKIHFSIKGKKLVKELIEGRI